MLNKVHDNKTSLFILDNGDWVSRDDIADALGSLMASNATDVLSILQHLIAVDSLLSLYENVISIRQNTVIK